PHLRVEAGWVSHAAAGGDCYRPAARTAHLWQAALIRLPVWRLQGVPVPAKGGLADLTQTELSIPTKARLAAPEKMAPAFQRTKSFWSTEAARQSFRSQWVPLPL